MLRKALIALVVGLAVPAVVHAQPSLVACCVPTSPTCQLLSPINCDNAHGIFEGDTCAGVLCGACCEGVGGNPNVCGDNFPIASCREGNGTVVFDARCIVDGTGVHRCVLDAPAPAMRWPLLVGAAGLLAAAGIYRVRRSARTH